MAFDIHTSHRTLFFLPLGIYIGLVTLVAIVPAMEMGRRYPPSAKRTGAAASPHVKHGEEVYKSLNCTVCHTQQIRGDERVRVQVGDRWVVPVRAPDARFGLDEPTRPEEYADASPPLIGTQRTGPDLTGVGDRLPSVLWHYWHLYDPRSVSPGSVMPSYRFLFRVTHDPQGRLEPDAAPAPSTGLLVVLGLGALFALLGWLLFGWTWSVVLATALGVGGGFLIVQDCQVCRVSSAAEIDPVEEVIDSLELGKDERLVATENGRDLAEYLLSLRRPVRQP